jgi:mRNA-degrading endonuclease RelE of RelBE toxin-antitoxin system
LERLESQSAGDVRALRGPYSSCFRLRVGKWRVLYRPVEPDQFEIFRVDNRGEVY